jgi:hypothetical protein
MADRLEGDERVLAGGFAWVAKPRPKVPLLFLARQPHLLALTDRRVVLWSRPRHGRAPEAADLVLDAPYATVKLVGEHVVTPMRQVQLLDPEGTAFVVEVRPRERRLGERLATELRGSS